MDRKDKRYKIILNRNLHRKLDRPQIIFFLDELYFYNLQEKSYVSKFSAGNFIKLLQERLKLESIFVIPVDVCKSLTTYSVKFDINKYDVYPLPGWDSIISYYRSILNPKIYFLLKKKVKELVNKGDIFWIRLPSPFGLWLGKEAEKNGKFVIYHVAGDIRLAYLSKKYTGFKRLLAKTVGNSLHKRSLKLGENGVFLCTGSVLYNTYNNLGKKTYLFIDSLISYNDLKEPKDDFEKPIKFLYVGRILEEKGIFFLINALKNLRTMYDFELHIVGFGRDEEKLKYIIRDENFIKFHGFIIQGEELYKIYKNCDIFVMPTITSEGFPRVILEAWANGLYVVSSRVGGIEGIGKDLENILFFEPGDKFDFSYKIDLLINNSEIRRKLKNGILKIQKTIVSDYMIDLVKDILSERELI
jgi:glycosyltransferase involved in cell wall biosynthesis